ncbi:MAG: LytTR family DNA-binding domain-containing protein [Bacteroidota bacterium]
MNLRQTIPDYFVRPRSTVIQIIFTSLFAYAFILMYHPFGSQNWYDVNQGQFAFYAGFLVVLGMVVVIGSRIIMTRIRKRWRITIAGYALMIALEVIAMAGFYMMIEKVFLKDSRYWFEVYYTAIQKTSLILLIPYLISLLYFAWEDKKQKLERLLVQRKQEEGPRFVIFHDENGEIRLTIKLDDLIYIEANENYVFIHYLEDNKPGRFLLRNSMKKIEEQLSDYPVVRCHRSYIINLIRVRLVKKNRTGFTARMISPEELNIPVSDRYWHEVQSRFLQMTDDG